MDQRDAFGESGCCQPGCLSVRLDFGLFDSDQVVEGLGSVDEPVVAVGEAGPEPCGEFLAEVDEGRAVMSAKAPVLRCRCRSGRSLAGTDRLPPVSRAARR